MKIRNIIFCLIGFFFTNCEDYLDKSPDMDMTDSVIYKDYESMRGFLDQVYREGYLIYMYESQTYANGSSCVGDLSDEYVNVRNDGPCLAVRSGNWLSNADADFEIGCKAETAIARAYKGLRVVNRVINNIDNVNNLTDDERNKLLGQAHFLRAYFYFEIIKRYGGMPKFDVVFDGSDNFDLPRMTYQESNAWLQSDLDLAIEYLPVKWPDEEHGRADRCAALALKAMTQLYAASPLMQNGLDAIEYKDYDKAMAAEAAKTAVKTLAAIDESGYYALSSHDDYKYIFTVKNPDTSFGHPEYLWYLRYHPGNWKTFKNVYWLTDPYVSGNGPQQAPYHAPSQNMVDLFERTPDGINYYPITDPRSGYDAVKNNDPYSHRDPRLTEFILVPGEPWGVNNEGKQMYITTYKGGYSENFILTQANITRGALQSGYMCKKFIWDTCNEYAGLAGYKKYKVFSVFIRVSQVYLDLAEAMFEATNNADATIEGCGDWTARKALNVIRNRAGIGDLPEGVDFREAYRRERAIELMFEGHRWYDIRRWMIADKLFAADYPIYGVEATPQDHSYTADQLIKLEACTYKIDKFTYQYNPIITEIRVFDKRNYWYPLPMDEVAALDNLKQNPGW